MRKLIFALLLAAFSLGASAQFEKGTKYVAASLSDFGLSYNKHNDFRLGLHATGGYFIRDGWMLLGGIGWEHDNGSDLVDVGVAGRYYMVRNGIYFNLGLKYQHTSPNLNNIYLTPEVGYCFYLNNRVSIEPAIYCDMSMNHFKDFTKIGFRIGFGYYF